MAKKGVTIKIPIKLHEEAKKEASRRNITVSKLFEISMIHELNKNAKHGTYYELKQIVDFINKIIDDLDLDEIETDTEEVKVNNEESSDQVLHEIEHLQNVFGHVTEGVIKTNATTLGLSFEEMLQLLNEKGIEILILK